MIRKTDKSSRVTTGHDFSSAGVEALTPSGQPRMPRQLFWRLCKHPAGLIGLMIVGLYLVLALAGEPLAPYSATAQHPADTLQPPSAHYWFGTDLFGRDVFSRVVVGSRDILVLSFSATALALLLGVSVGLLAGYYGGLIDDWLMRGMDILLAFPTLLLALLILSTLGPQRINLIIGIGVVWMPHIARVVRSVVLAVREQDFIDAARLRGESDLAIMLREILPNISSPIIVEGSLSVSYSILLGSALGFLGLGVQPPAPDWGLQVSEGRNLILTAPWVMIFPSLAISSLVVGVNLLADGLQTVLEGTGPSLQQATRPQHTAQYTLAPMVPADSPAYAARDAALHIEDLHVAYRQQGRWINVVHGMSLSIARGETVGLVGESGCGKTTVALATMRYLGRNGRITGGQVLVQGQNVRTMSQNELRRLRGKQVGMVYQNPQAALNPSLRIAVQLMELVRLHEGADEHSAYRRALAMLERVHMPDPEAIMQRYPHQLSGGMQQRVVIAMALMTNPAVLIMDEPTTGLDVTTEAAVLDLVNEVKQSFDTAILYISHDLRVVARVCDRVGVMYAGQLVESGPIDTVFRQPRHPYMHDLLACMPGLNSDYRRSRLHTIAGHVPSPTNVPAGCAYHPRCSFARDRCQQERPLLAASSQQGTHHARCFFSDEVAAHEKDSVPDMHAHRSTDDQQQRQHQEPLLALTHVSKYYAQQRMWSNSRKQSQVRAVNDVSLTIQAGETFALVGESGCGKTTLGRCVVGLLTPTTGKLVFRGSDAALPVAQRPAHMRQAMQMVFQQPETTLNPRHTVGQVLDRTLFLLGVRNRRERQRRVTDLLTAVRLEHSYTQRYPGQLSGGEKQRIAIARAFAGTPAIVVCDEAVSALDVSVQAAILNLLVDLQREQHSAYLFVSHDLEVVRYLADRVGVMYLGQLVEIGTAAQVFAAPSHPYTEALLAAVAPPEHDAPSTPLRLAGPLPSLSNPPAGCPFHTRCPRKLGTVCEEEIPPWQDAGDGHRIACHIPHDELATMAYLQGKQSVS